MLQLWQSQLKLRATEVIGKAKNDYQQKLEPVTVLMETLFSPEEKLELGNQFQNRLFIALFATKLNNLGVVQEELLPKFVMVVKD